MLKDFYDLFGVDPDAEEKQLKKAYRVTIREYHPDISDSENAEEKFKAARKAFDVLDDVDERKKYDKLGHHKYVAAYMDEELINIFEFEEPKPDASRPVSTGITTQKVAKSRGQATPQDRWNDRNEREKARRKKTRTERRRQARPGSKTADVPFRPKVRRDLLAAVTAIAFATIVYLVGIHSYLTSYESELQAILASLSADSNILVSLQSSIQSGRFGIPTPVSYIESLVEAPMADPLALAFPIGMVLLPLTLSVIVYRFGDSRTWWYVVGVMTPVFAAAFNFAGIPLPPHIEFIPYVAIPLITSIIFFGDIMSHILSKFISYYREAYSLPRLGGK